MRIALGYSWSPAATGYHLERALRALGHVVIYVGSARPQRAGYNHAPLDKVIEHLPERPDLYLYIDSAGRYFPAGIERAPVPTACYLIDVHLGRWRQQVARFFDAIFIAQKDYIPVFTQAVGHEQVYWLPLAAAPDVHYDHHLLRTYDVGFVGNIALAHRKTARARRLKLIAERFRTNDFYHSYTPEQVGQVYSESRIVFNTSIAGDVTMRVFEGTACGALVLTNSIANGLDDLFDVGKEIVTYTDDTDLTDKITYYLSHRDECEQIARAGYARTQEQHTYARRAQTILDLVDEPSFRQMAPMRTCGIREQQSARRDVYTHLHMLDAILDQSREVGEGPLARMLSVLPTFLRRLLV